MNPIKEKRYLNRVLEKFDSNKRPIYIRTWFNFVLWVPTGLLIATGIRLFEKGIINIWFILIGSLFIGGLFGIFSIIQLSEKYWPFIKEHLNKDSIKRRLDELDS
ncbi:MAG: hypothetical protein OEZ58_18980 [Gammaproteobacteria bacterium]|nr:hypothetical protein [Gammaproteobacteria bacterium]